MALLYYISMFFFYVLILNAHEPTKYYEVINLQKNDNTKPKSIHLKIKGTQNELNGIKQDVMCVLFDKNGKELTFQKLHQNNIYTEMDIIISDFKFKKIHSVKCYDPKTK